jgi:6-phosphogluconolactonase
MIERFPTPGQAAAACAARIARGIGSAVAERPAATLAVSGGTAVKLLFPALLAQGIPWDRVHLFWVDERGVPPADEQSNFRLANELLVVPSGIPPANVHRIRGELDAAEAAALYTAEIRRLFGLDGPAIPEFDVIHHGMGPDGHTASLFPGELLIEDRRGIAAGIYVPHVKQWRITLLPAPLLAARDTVFFATGSEKAEALREVLEGEYRPLQYPSQMVSRNARRVSWFVDDAAAAQLKGF